MKQELLHFTITNIISETGECKTFYLKPSSHIHYKAGQFLPFIFIKNGREIRRSYSFSSSPDADKHISITIKRTVNGEMSRWWMNEAKIGDSLNSLPAAGMFTIDYQETPRDIFLTAAGSGITPIYSLIKSLLIREPKSRIHLIYSNSNLHSAIFLQSLESLARQYPTQFSITWLFSNALNVFEARLGTFNLERIIRENIQYNKEDALVYTCGPYHYMLMVQITCRSMGIPDTHIRKELFDINDTSAQPPKYFDEQNRSIIIHYNNQEYVLLVPYNQSILAAALEKDIPLPYSCRAGRCSTCICRVKKGNIWMHNNEVLTDHDLASGLALTCTGHPTTDDVVIEM